MQLIMYRNTTKSIEATSIVTKVAAKNSVHEQFMFLSNTPWFMVSQIFL